MPTAVAPIESRSAVMRRQFAAMALTAQGRPFGSWPAWSTGEVVIVALVLDRQDVLRAMGYTILEAIERVDLFTIAELRRIAHEVMQ